MKIAVITCYFDPDYIRARTLRAALKTLPGVQVIVVKNTKKGMARYAEMPGLLRQVKKQHNPDVYLLTFRGQEILPLVLGIAGKKPVWFDEFIVPIAYATGEKHRKSMAIRTKHFLARRSEPLYKRWLNKCAVILADTQAHAELSARMSHQNLSKYVAVPVGTDETLFKPASKPAKGEKFQVFYYSTGMQPLHGIPVVLAAAEKLKDQPEIEFLIVGGKKPMEEVCKVAQSRGANLRYESWIPFEKLVDTIQQSSLCLGGPFGDTPQAQHVITGKTYQYLACAAPALIGASEATSEYFTDKENALVVPQANPDALAKAIMWAYNQPDELASIADKGRKLYEKQFSTTAIAKILQPLVESV